MMKKDLIKSTLTDEDFAKAYELLDIPVLQYDCGRLCGNLCCQEYQPGVGMYLLPGEECMFTGKEPWLQWSFHNARDHDFPPEYQGVVAFVKCNGVCPREKRPIQCRTFPLMPYLDSHGNLSVVHDGLNGILICPLIRNPDKYPLNPDFVNNALKAWQILSRDPFIKKDIEWQSRHLEKDSYSPWKKLFR
jgi:hypothetical protein